MSNRYEITEWLDFICDGQPPSDGLVSLKNEFQKAVSELWDKTFLSLYPSTYDDLAYNTYASFTGMGVGLWEGDEAGHVEFEPIALKDKNLQALSGHLEIAIFDEETK